MISPGEPSNEKEALVVQFFADMGDTYSAMKRAFEQYLHNDCVWANQGLPAVHGKPEVMAFLHQFADQVGLECVGGEVLNIATVPGTNTVLTERHERWTGKDAVLLVESLPVMGTFEIADEKIKSWRDYYDPSLLAHLLPGT